MRAAAFELVPLVPELPIITLAADGTMASRRWVCALQQAIEYVEDDGEGAAGAGAGAAAACTRLSLLVSLFTFHW